MLYIENDDDEKDTLVSLPSFTILFFKIILLLLLNLMELSFMIK